MLPAPDDRAVLAHVALVHVIAVDLSLAHKLDFSNFSREIIRIGNVLERLGKKFIYRIAEDAAQHSVDPEPPAIGSDVCDSNRRIFERGPEPRLAVACQSKLNQRTFNEATKCLNAQSCHYRINLYRKQ